MNDTKRRTPEDWALAALVDIAERGFGKISVERLALRLGVTKGSFYWHYKNRAALQARVLQLWEEHAFAEVVRRLREVSAPDERLTMLLREALSDPLHLRVEAAIGAAVQEGHHLASETATRVREGRLAFLEEIYVDLEVENPAAWARGAYAAFLGCIQMAASEPLAPPVGEGVESFHAASTFDADLVTVLVNALQPR